MKFYTTTMTNTSTRSDEVVRKAWLLDNGDYIIRNLEGVKA